MLVQWGLARGAWASTGGWNGACVRVVAGGRDGDDAVTTMTIDEQARRLMLAVSESARADLKVAGLSPRALGELYLRIRERLRKRERRKKNGAESFQALAEDLALTIYLAWLAEDDPPGPDLLVVLKSSVEKVLQDSDEGE